MIYRILFFVISIIVLFIPIYMFINWIYKKIYVYNETSNLKDEFEKNKNSKEILEKEISNKIETLKQEQEKLKNIK